MFVVRRRLFAVIALVNKLERRAPLLPGAKVALQAACTVQRREAVGRANYE